MMMKIDGWRHGYATTKDPSTGELVLVSKTLEFNRMGRPPYILCAIQKANENKKAV